MGLHFLTFLFQNNSNYFPSIQCFYTNISILKCFVTLFQKFAFIFVTLLTFHDYGIVAALSSLLSRAL